MKGKPKRVAWNRHHCCHCSGRIGPPSEIDADPLPLTPAEWREIMKAMRAVSRRFRPAKVKRGR